MSGSTAKGVVVIATLGITLFCCVFGAVRMAQRAPVTSVAPVATTQTAAPAAPTVTPLEVAMRRLAAGETLAPAECLALTMPAMEAPVDAHLTPTHDPRIWPLLECQWRANHSQGGQVVLAIALKLETIGHTAPPERIALVNEVTAYFAANPIDLIPDALTKSYLEIEMRDLEGGENILDALVRLCPACERSTAIRDARRRLAARAAEFPIDVGSINTLQLRYADIKGRLVRVRGFVLADTYYNCKYRSQSQWRGMKLRQGLRSFDRMNVYCPRGNETCDRVYEIATTGNLEGTALVRYPTSNRICEQTQAELVDFLADE